MKKYLLFALLLLAMIMTLVACGLDETSSDTDVENPVKDQIEAEVPNDTVELDDTEEPVEPDDTEDLVEPDNTEDPVAEMVDWETWATQADNDEVCLVVWNETTGTQKILEPVLENGSIYTVEEGDKFAIPKRSNIDFVLIGYDTKLYCGLEEKEYMEFDLPVGEIIEVHIMCSDQKDAISYWFNY